MKRRNQVIRFAFVDVEFAIWTNPWIEVSLANLVMFSTSFIFQYECLLDDQCFPGRKIGFVSMLQFLMHQSFRRPCSNKDMGWFSFNHKIMELFQLETK